MLAKEPEFDLGPVIESYVNTASAFFNWFVDEINMRDAKIKIEYMNVAEALKEWYEHETGMKTEGFRKLFGPPSGGNRSQRRGQRQHPKQTTKRQRRKK